MEYSFTAIDSNRAYDYEELVWLHAELLRYGTERLKIALTQVQLPNGATFRDEAVAKWHIYLGVLTVDHAEAIPELIESNKARAIQALNRSIYEYVTKVKYFACNQKEAARQFRSIDARMFKQLLTLEHPSEEFASDLAKRADEWTKQNPSVTAYDGEKKFTSMYLAIAPKSKVRTDSEGNEYTPEFRINYGVPSLLAHGDVAAMEDVLPHVRSKHELEYRYESGLADVLQELQKSCGYLWQLLLHLARFYKLPWSDIVQLTNRGAMLLNLDLDRRRRKGQGPLPSGDAPISEV